MSNKAESKPCPLCRRRPPSADHAPFCSPGCKDRDLLKWLGEGYRIAGPPGADESLGGVDSDNGSG